MAENIFSDTNKYVPNQLFTEYLTGTSVSDQYRQEEHTRGQVFLLLVSIFGSEKEKDEKHFSVDFDARNVRTK